MNLKRKEDIVMNSKELVKERFQESINVKEQNIKDEELLANVVQIADEITKAIKKGHKLVLCGNGGSASDALHFAGEIVGRFQKERSAWSAVVLNADVATMRLLMIIAMMMYLRARLKVMFRREMFSSVSVRVVILKMFCVLQM